MKLSITMENSLQIIANHDGYVRRYPGGFWRCHDYDSSLATPTIEALVKRKLLEYSDWKDGRNGRFPVAAIITDAGRARVGGAMTDLTGALHTVRDALYMSKRVAEPCIEESDYYRVVVDALALLDQILAEVKRIRSSVNTSPPPFAQLVDLLATITQEPKK